VWVKSGEFAFGDYRLDRPNALLWRGEERVVLAPKPFEVLCCLVERAGELVTKDELLDAVWRNLNVSDSSLTVAMNALRAALHDDRNAPNYIETVTRRGYRFIASVGSGASLRSTRPAQPSRAEPPAAPDERDERRAWRVGRDVPLEILEGVVRRVLAERRQVVFVTGESGIGKTTFVQMAVERMKRGGWGVLHAGCNELFGTHEAFLPLIESLQELCRGAEGAFMLKSLRAKAPTWLAQTPWLLGDEDRASFQQEVFGATRERMLREFCDLMEALAADRPWVIILEDMHWSDLATVDALSRIANRDRCASILVLATYRPADLAAAGHPLGSVHQDLRIHGRSTEIALERLSRIEVKQHLALRFNSDSLAGRLTERVFARTGGHPLFVVSLVDHLIAQGAIVKSGDEWRIATEPPPHGMPRDLHEMITRQLDRLASGEKNVLEVASAAGTTFPALLVARAMDRDVLDVEEICEELVRSGRVLISAGVAEWPDGAISGSYAFGHALYQEVLYQQLAPARRSKTHRLLGECLEGGYCGRSAEVASTLALHFDLGRDFAKALRYLGLAAESSARRFSTREAASYLTRALELAPQLPAEARTTTRLRLLLQRAWIWRAGGDFIHALEDLGMMVAHASETGHVRDEISGLVNLSRFHLYVDRSQCLPLAEQAVEKSGLVDDAAIKALAEGNLANLNLMLRGWSADDAEGCREAARLIDDAQDFSARMRRYSMEMVLEFLSSNYSACYDATSKGRDLTRMVGDVYLFVIYNTVEAFAWLYLGEWGRVRDMVASALAISERNVNVQASVLCRLTTAWLYVEALDFEAGARLAEETLNPAVERNPFSFYVGRNILAKAYLGQGDLASARQHLDAMEQRVEHDGVAMESTVIQHYYLSRCNYRLAVADFDRARREAARLQELTSIAPDYQFLALSYEAMARIAMAADAPEDAASPLARAVSIVRNRRLPVAGRKIYDTAAKWLEARGAATAAGTFRRRSEKIATALANSLDPGDPLRAAPYFSGLG
jgi:DNA-binding winged helix-turn-helix (wHTH) protein/tetratricopeptide (TPR) repeat protein